MTKLVLARNGAMPGPDLPDDSLRDTNGVVWKLTYKDATAYAYIDPASPLSYKEDSVQRPIVARAVVEKGDAAAAMAKVRGTIQNYAADHTADVVQPGTVEVTEKGKGSGGAIALVLLAIGVGVAFARRNRR